jgi:glycosyltransferase involved in cell wall biosynthesis
VIGTRPGGTISQIDHGRNGLLYEAHDDAPLAERIGRCIDDPSFAAGLSSEAESDARTRYSHDAQCEAWERVIGGLAG